MRVSWIRVVLILAPQIAGCASPEAAAPSAPRERSRISIVRERPGDVRVEGVGAIRGFAKGRDCTFMHCLELVLEATGRKIGYDELMGLSGMAFRTRFRVDQWDVGNADPLAGESCLDVLFAAIGWSYEAKVIRHEDYAEVDALFRAVGKSIEAGIPVLAANVIPPEDWGIIVGTRGARTWLCRSYNGDAERVDRPATGRPTAVVFLTGKKPRPDAKKEHVESVRRAVESFERKTSSGPYATGSRALEVWREALLTPKDRTYIHANFWTYVNLIDARGAAARYLRSIAKDFGGRDMHVVVAADYYDREVRLLLAGMSHVPSESAYPSGMPPAALRSRQVEILQEAQDLETKAIASLKKAL